MHDYLETLMSRGPVLEDWEIVESARYAFKCVLADLYPAFCALTLQHFRISARLIDWEFSRPGKARVDTDPTRVRTESCPIVFY